MTNKQKIIKVFAIILAGFIIANIISLIISIILSITGIFVNNSEGDKITTTYSYENIEKIEIDSLDASIIIKEGTEFKLETTNIAKKLKTRLKNQTLKIEENKSLFNLNKESGRIIITIPNATILEELSIDTGAGKFVMDDIKVKELDLDCGAGILEINNSFIYKTDIDGGAGKINIVNTTLNNLDLDSGVGKVEIEAYITGDSQISQGVGEIDITLLGNEDDYKINLNKGIGNIKINDRNQENSTVYGNGFNKLEIDGGIGNISIGFK